MTEPVRILIADDHAPTRADVRAVLEAHPSFAVCAEEADALRREFQALRAALS